MFASNRDNLPHLSIKVFIAKRPGPIQNEGELVLSAEIKREEALETTAKVSTEKIWLRALLVLDDFAEHHC